MKRKEENKSYRLLAVMTKHVGQSRAISMEQLYREIFDEDPDNLVNSTRVLRRIVERARRNGLPICSIRRKDFHGYFLAGSSSELEEYCRRLRKEALRKLAMEAKLRKITLVHLINELSLSV